MGLDMYLEKRTYVKNWDFMKPEERITVTVTQRGKPFPGIDPSKVTSIIEEAGYWRKANAIHAWFVEHVQDGKDDCNYYYVSKEQLQKLLDTVNRVLEASHLIYGSVTVGIRFEGGKGEPFVEVPIREEEETIEDATVAEELLPTQSGFFFGSTDYDQSYIEDLKQTKAILEAVLADQSSGDYYYHSSW